MFSITQKKENWLYTHLKKDPITGLLQAKTIHKFPTEIGKLRVNLCIPDKHLMYQRLTLPLNMNVKEIKTHLLLTAKDLFFDNKDNLAIDFYHQRDAHLKKTQVNAYAIRKNDIDTLLTSLSLEKQQVFNIEPETQAIFRLFDFVSQKRFCPALLHLQEQCAFFISKDAKKNRFIQIIPIEKNSGAEGAADHLEMLFHKQQHMKEKIHLLFIIGEDFEKIKSLIEKIISCDIVDFNQLLKKYFMFPEKEISFPGIGACLVEYQ